MKKAKPAEPRTPEGHWRNYLSKEYLNAEELDPGREYPLTLSRCMVEEVFNRDTCSMDDVLVAYFVEMEERHRLDPKKYATNKRLILGNKWNMERLEEITGKKKPAEWKNVPVAIYRGNEGCQNKKQFGVRIKAPTPVPTK